MPALTVRCTVEGRVQGVFYRASTSERAAELGLSGWVRNLDDGRVELAASGDSEAIEALVSWLWDGPSGADVTAVTVSECLDRIEPGFRILR